MKSLELNKAQLSIIQSHIDRHNEDISSIRGEINCLIESEGKDYLTSARGLDNLKIISQHKACIAALNELVLELNGVVL